MESICEDTEYFDKIEREFLEDPQDFYPFGLPEPIKPIKPIKVLKSKNGDLDERTKFAWETLKKYFSVDERKEAKRDEELQKVIQELEGYNARARH